MRPRNGLFCVAAAAVLIIGSAVGELRAGTVIVPNHSFEKLYKPGTAITGVVAPNGWTQGVGPACPIDSGQYQFSDTSTGSVADIPGWVGADRAGWVALGGTYGRDQTTGNLQGSIARQLTPPDGIHYYLSNGGNWGNPAGGLIVSDASLGPVETGLVYTLSMFANTWSNPNPAIPIELNLLAGGTVIPPTHTMHPTLSSSWQKYSRTYAPAALAPFAGQPMTIQLGVSRGAVGWQSRFDNVSLSFEVPEPLTMTCLFAGVAALGGYVRKRRPQA